PCSVTGCAMWPLDFHRSYSCDAKLQLQSCGASHEDAGAFDARPILQPRGRPDASSPGMSERKGNGCSQLANSRPKAIEDRGAFLSCDVAGGIASKRRPTMARAAPVAIC